MHGIKYKICNPKISFIFFYIILISNLNMTKMNNFLFSFEKTRSFLNCSRSHRLGFLRRRSMISSHISPSVFLLSSTFRYQMKMKKLGGASTANDVVQLHQTTCNLSSKIHFYFAFQPLFIVFYVRDKETSFHNFHFVVETRAWHFPKKSECGEIERHQRGLKMNKSFQHFRKASDFCQWHLCVCLQCP